MNRKWPLGFWMSFSILLALTIMVLSEDTIPCIFGALLALYILHDFKAIWSWARHNQKRPSRVDYAGYGVRRTHGESRNARLYQVTTKNPEGIEETILVKFSYFDWRCKAPLWEKTLKS